MFVHRMMNVIVVMLASLLLYLVSPMVHAVSDQAVTEQVRAQLIASVDAVHPGEKILLGIHQRIIPHWHTYWLNPGDSGVATAIAWDLPKGASAGDIQWPVPSRFKLGPVTNYGYANEVTLLSPMTVSKDITPGGTFPITAKVNWLVCEEICIPQQVELSLVLPVAVAGQASGRGSPLIDKARAGLPVASPWPVTIEHNKESLSLRIAGAGQQAANVKDVWFYPAEWGKIPHGAAQPWQIDDNAIVLKLERGEAPAKPGDKLEGVLVITENIGAETVSRGFVVNTSVGPATPQAAIEASTLHLSSALLLALLGGVILNLMPCVFPILSMKALSLLKHAHQATLQTRLHGIAYTVGVLASFAVLGGLLIALKAGGAQIGWGFQFQSPLFVLLVAYLMFAVGLNLSGVFSVGGSVMGIGSSLAERGGYAGSFFTGVLATIVATPCTAPFMGAALGYALAQPPVALMAVFLSLGFGVALPYLLLSTWPLLQRLLPRPGIWMERVKQGLAFPVYATAAWLVWVLAQQAGTNAVAIALGGMVGIAFSSWLYENTRTGGTLARRGGMSIASLTLAVALAGGYAGIKVIPANASNTASADKYWEPYSPERLQALRADGKPVFLNLTAAWCITCLVNERVALSESSVADAFRKADITYLKGDWTNQDHQITKILAEFGRSGVPLYVIYPSDVDAKPVVLPQILTPEIVLTAVNKSVTPSR